jgi:uncharacterized RDD family membrane protein YckC
MEPETVPTDAAPTGPVGVNPSRRLASGLVDVVAIIIAGVSYTLSLGKEQGVEGGIQMTINDKTVTGGLAWFFVALALAYFVVAELATGRTLGKAVTGLTVQVADGSPLTPGAAIVRNLMRIVDGVPYILPNLLGFIVVASTDKRQRIGDLVAKTVVVRA